MELICCGKPVRINNKTDSGICSVCGTFYGLDAMKPKPKQKVDVDLKVKFLTLMVILLTVASCNMFLSILGQLWSK